MAEPWLKYKTTDGPWTKHAKAMGTAAIATAKEVVDFVPVVGDVKGAYDTVESIKAGDNVGAALGMIGMMPIIGDILSKGGKAIRKGGLKGFKLETTTPNFDEAMKDPEYFRDAKKVQVDMVEMTPSEYIRAAAEGFTAEGFPMGPISLRESRNMKLVNQYAADMEKGDKFPALYLDYSKGSFGQEGLHRAMAAERAGLDTVPVAIRKDVGQKL